MYNIRLEEVKNFKIILNTPGLKKNPKDYKNLCKYDITSISVKENASHVLYYVTNEDLFDILTCHIKVEWYLILKKVLQHYEKSGYDVL